MMLSDWISAAIAVLAIVLLCLKPRIPYGKPSDHAGELDQDGKPVSNQWMVRQAKRDCLRRFLLWVIAAGSVCALILRKLAL